MFLLSKRFSTRKIFSGLLMYNHKYKYIIKLLRENLGGKTYLSQKRLVKFGTILDNLTLGE